MCPHCSHDLRGLPVQDALIRCPECGAASTLKSLARARQLRERNWARWMIGGIIVAFILIAILVVRRG
ncbi:MAG: hypothetical protein ACR2GY_02335 [Phycisphaerales bacterium]